MYENFSNFESVFGVLLLVAAALLILRTLGYRGVPVIAAMVPVILLGGIMSRLGDTALSFGELISAEGLSEYASAAFRVVGIGYLGGVGSDICRELGEGGIAKCINLATRAELIIISAPYVVRIVDTLVGFINE